MGGILSIIERIRNWQGYYSDMVDGYICQLGGWPFMIRFPKELQGLPTRCPFCHERSTLNLPEMYKRLTLERQKFKEHTNKIIADRVAEGLSQPYPCYKYLDDEDSKWKRRRSDSSISFLRYVKNSTISPEEESESDKEDDPFYYPVSIRSIIVCECMKCKLVEMEPSEKDELLALEKKDVANG